MVNIYALKDAGKVFYVGKSIDMQRRVLTHVSESSAMKCDKDRIISKIISEGRELEVDLLERCDDVDGPERERYYIAWYQSRGNKLFNYVHNTNYNLSKIELQVLLLMAQDLETEAIASVLMKSARTVETIRQHIKKKANVKTLPGLIMWGINAGYITTI